MNNERGKGPQQIGDTLSDALARLDVSRRKQQQKRIEAAARPGESWEQAAARLSAEDPLHWAVVRDKSPPPAKPNFFVPTLYDVGTKDSRSIMDVAVFRLSKRDKRAGEVIRYELPGGDYVQVSAGAAGMASVWDYDLVLMAMSHLTEAMNRYREGRGEKPGRIYRPHVADVLKFCQRSDGGKQKNDLVEACIRLNTTHIAMKRTRKDINGRTVTVSEGESLISRYEIITNKSGKAEYIEIELANWMYRQVVEGKHPDVLTVHPDYFLINQGIARFIYRLARRAAGKGDAKWSFQTIYERSGSTGTFKEFCRILRKLVEANDLPEYNLREEAGQSGPQLLMTNRSIEAQPPEADCGV